MQFVTASGAMRYDGKGWPWEQPLKLCRLLDIHLFTHFMKTVTLYPRQGNFRWWKPWDCVRPIWNNYEIVGAVNAFGLTNPGFMWWARKIGQKVDSSKVELAGSIFGDPLDIERMAKGMNDFDIVALELNASCPNTQDDTLSNTKKIIKSCEVAKANSHHPIILKLSVVHDIRTIIPAVEGMIEAISINSVPWKIAFPNLTSPLAKYGSGGVSGKVVQQLTLLQKICRMTFKLHVFILD
jgi:dihydroorotate dehydrogenase